MENKNKADHDDEVCADQENIVHKVNFYPTPSTFRLDLSKYMKIHPDSINNEILG